MKLEDGADTKLLAYPQALIKICYFLMDSLREKGAKTKPMICASVIPSTKMVLVVGVANRPRLGHKNLVSITHMMHLSHLGSDWV